MPDFDIVNKELKEAWVKRPSIPECAMWKSLPLEYLETLEENSFSIAISH